MTFIIKNEYSVVLGEIEAETEQEALDAYAQEDGYESFDDMPARNREKLKVTEKTSGFQGSDEEE